MTTDTQRTSEERITDVRLNELARYFEAKPNNDSDLEVACALRELERLRDADDRRLGLNRWADNANWGD